jgi:hypothetical protein
MQDSTSAPLTNRIDEHDDICRVVQLYIDGTANGDVSKLKEAFHDDARMFGGFLGSRLDRRKCAQSWMRRRQSVELQTMIAI